MYTCWRHIQAPACLGPTGTLPAVCDCNSCTKPGYGDGVKGVDVRPERGAGAGEPVWTTFTCWPSAELGLQLSAVKASR